MPEASRDRSSWTFDQDMVYLQVLGFLVLVYSGGFVLPLVYCRVRRRMPWHQCIVPAVLGFVLFLLLATSVAGSRLREVPWNASCCNSGAYQLNCGAISFVFLAYLSAASLRWETWNSIKYLI